MSNVHFDDAQRRSVLIRGCGIITMDPALGDLTTGDIHIRDGIIVAIGRDLNVAEAEVIEASNMIAMPGFIDSHRHLWEGVIRNALPTEDLNGYFAIVNQGFARAYTAEDAYLGTLASALGALDAGITTVFDWAHIQTTPEHTAATIAALREAGLRTVYGFGPPGRQDGPHRWPHDLLRLQKEEFSSRDQLLTLALASLSPEHCPDEMAKAHFAMAREAGLIVTVHAAMNGFGEPDQILRFGKEGQLGPHVQLVHCNTLTPDEWRIVADTGTSICFTPSSEMQMGHGVPPVQQAIDAGVLPSIGVDVETSAPGDMWTQMRLVYALQRMQSHERKFKGGEAPRCIDCNDVLQYATVAGAATTRLHDKVGALVPGRQADIILLRADMANVMPVNDMKSAVVLNMDARNVDTVMVAGKVVKRGGSLVGVDLAKLNARLYQSRDRLYAEAVQPLRSAPHRLSFERRIVEA